MENKLDNTQIDVLNDLYLPYNQFSEALGCIAFMQEMMEEYGVDNPYNLSAVLHSLAKTHREMEETFYNTLRTHNLID